MLSKRVARLVGDRPYKLFQVDYGRGSFYVAAVEWGQMDIEVTVRPERSGPYTEVRQVFGIKGYTSQGQWVEYYRGQDYVWRIEEM